MRRIRRANAVATFVGTADYTAGDFATVGDEDVLKSH